MTTITHTFTTPRGAVVTLIAKGGMISAEVNGKPHTTWNVKLGYDNEVGHHAVLAGNVRAPIADIEAARKFFAESKDLHTKWLDANREAGMKDGCNFSQGLSEDMDRAYSNN